MAYLSRREREFYLRAFARIVMAGVRNMPQKDASAILIEVRSGDVGQEAQLSSPSQLLSRYSSPQRANMPNALRINRVTSVLERLFAAAAKDDETPRWRRPGLSWETATAQERADASESAYMPISPEAGGLLYI